MHGGYLRGSRYSPYDIETCPADLESVRAHYGIDRRITGGHSWGAGLALY